MLNNVYEKSLWREGSKTFRPGGLALTAHALAFCNLRAGARVLDVGCGVGASLNCLVGEHQLDAVGADISAELLTRAQSENSRLALAQADAMLLPYASETFDAIFCECTLSLFSNCGHALSEIARVLKHDGYLIVTDVYARNTEMHNVLTRETIMAQMQAHNLRVALWQEHSAELQKFAAQMIWASGSFEHFFQNTALAHVNAISLADARNNLGYYLLIARKGGA